MGGGGVILKKIYPVSIVVLKTSCTRPLASVTHVQDQSVANKRVTRRKIHTCRGK